MPTHRILGIDPGSRKTGYGVVEIRDNRLFYLGSGCIHTGDGPLHKRLLVIFDSVSALLEQFQPTEVAIEETFVSKNAQSTIKLSEARAVAMVTAARAGLEVYGYTPTRIKSAVVGYGKAEKNQVQYMIKNILHLSGLPQVDASDALACAVCHSHTIKLRQTYGTKGSTAFRGRHSW